jgi:hypothetical protein
MTTMIKAVVFDTKELYFVGEGEGGGLCCIERQFLQFRWRYVAKNSPD